MATKWEEPIKKAKRLTIFPTAAVTGGPWGGVFTQALTVFNALSTSQGLGVTFAKSAIPPDPNGSGGADVQFHTANGATTFTSFGQQFSLNLSGIAAEGDTQQVKATVLGDTRIAKAFIFVPSTPKVGAASSRDLGDPVKLVIAVHELIHACGLSNSDHSRTDADIFFGFPSLRAGVKPSDDRVVVGPQDTVMPPIVLSRRTAAIIQVLWVLPSHLPVHLPRPFRPPI